MPVRNIKLEFDDFSGGKNNVAPPNSLKTNESADTLNFIHEANGGLSFAPGYNGVQDSELFSATCTGWFNYIHDDGTNSIIAVSDEKVYSVDISTPDKTQIGTMAGPGECYAVNAAGKLWITNGTSFVKVEDDLSVYQVTINAPTTGAAAAFAGGSLALGNYDVYLSYARYDSGTGLWLYSYPQSLGTVTLAGLNKTVRVTLTASSDPQVNKNIVWMTDVGGSVPYYYGEASAATTTIDITSTANRNASILMSTVAASNQALPISPDAIYYFDDRLFIWDIGSKNIYWSLKTDVNPFDMERFVAENFRTMPLSINAIFSVGDNLYFNHIGNGITIAYGGDVSSIIKRINTQFWYVNQKTPDGKSNTVDINGIRFGLTNDGFRFFDGERFSDDISFKIKPDIDKVYLTSSSLYSAIVNRRANKRTEYRFCYRNLNYGTVGLNDQLVFNVDFYFNQFEQKICWERWENGFSYMLVSGGTWYGLQNGATTSQVVYEAGRSDTNCFIRTGAFTTNIFVKQVYLLTRTLIDNLDVQNIFGNVYGLATASGTISGNIIIFDNNNIKFPFSVTGTPSGLAVLPSEASGLGLALPFVMSPQYPINTLIPMPFDCKGNSVALEFSQTENDLDLFIYKIQIPRIKEIRNNLT